MRQKVSMVIIAALLVCQSTFGQPPRAIMDEAAVTNAAEGMLNRYGPVVEGESLWTITEKIKDHFPHTRFRQIMESIYRYNPTAFRDDNINSLEVGSILTLPTLGSRIKHSLLFPHSNEAPAVLSDTKKNHPEKVALEAKGLDTVDMLKKSNNPPVTSGGTEVNQGASVVMNAPNVTEIALAHEKNSPRISNTTADKQASMLNTSNQNTIKESTRKEGTMSWFVIISGAFIFATISGLFIGYRKSLNHKKNRSTEEAVGALFPKRLDVVENHADLEIKLDIARAYIDVFRNRDAENILLSVIRLGDKAQQESARQLSQSILKG